MVALFALPAAAAADTTRVSVSWDKLGPDVDLHVWDEQGREATEISNDIPDTRVPFTPAPHGAHPEELVDLRSPSTRRFTVGVCMFDSHGYGPVKTTVKVTDPDGSVRTFQPNIQHAGDRAIVAVSPDGPPAPFLGKWCRGEGGGLPPPGAFDLGEPADGTGLAEPGDVKFTWGKSTGAGLYSLELDGKVVADTAATEATVQVGEGEHSWRVLARNDGNATPSTSTRTLIVGGGVMTKPSPSGEGCGTEIVVGGRTAWSSCFKRKRHGWTSRAPVRIAGLDVGPRSGAVTLGDDGKLTGDAELSVKSSDPALPKGKLRLYRGELEMNLRSRFTLPFQIPGSDKIKLAGLPLKGTEFEVGWTADGAALKLALGLGKDVTPLVDPGGPVDVDKKLPLGLGLTVELKTSNATGLVLSKLEGKLDAAKVFDELVLKSVLLRYEPQYKLWTGGASVEPFGGPMARFAIPAISAEVGLTVDPIGFGKVKLEVSDLHKPLGTTGLFLEKFGGEVKRVPPPWAISASVGLTLGPEVSVPALGDVAAAAFDGSATYEPRLKLSTSGTAKLLNQPVSEAKLVIDLGKGSASFDGHLALLIADSGLEGDLNGWIVHRSFQVTGGAAIKLFGTTLAGGRGLVGDIGAGACVDTAGPDWGWSWDFREGMDGLRAMLGACDFGTLVRAKPSAAAIAGTRAFRVARGTRGVMLRVRAQGGQPAVRLRGPGVDVNVPATTNVTRDAPLSPGATLSTIRDPGQGDLYLVLAAPPPGAWTVEALPGAPALAPLDRSLALPRAHVRARVRRAPGGRMVLRWRAPRVRGQRLAFVETGRGGLAHVIARTRKARGRLRFRPADAPAVRRRLRVVVEQDGVPRTSLRLRRFRVHPARLRAPRGLRIERRGHAVTIRWRRVPRAAGYVVGGRLSGGRRLAEPTRRPRLRLRRVARSTHLRVRVRALSSAGRRGRAARARR